MHHYREAETKDIDRLHFVRMAVKENTLSNPDLVKKEDYEIYLTDKGKGWICEIESAIVGFAILDTSTHNIWALFLLPEYEKQGIGRILQKMMLDWYFSRHTETLWLSTSPHTRAESFYRNSGWKETGITSSGEVRFEMSLEAWKQME